MTQPEPSDRAERRPVEEVDAVGLGRRPIDEVDDEIAFHLEERTDQLMTTGLTREAARAQAEAEFGAVPAARTDLVRHVASTRARRRRAGIWSEWTSDLRYALRVARSRPGPFLVAVLSIALGMAAVSTMWTAVDRLILRPLPYDQERELVFVGSFQRGGNASTPSAPGDLLDLRAAARTVDLAGYRDGEGNLAGDLPEWVSVRQATPGFFEVLEVQPALGRAMRATDVDASGPQVALLDHGLWTRRFGADAGVIGQTLRLDGRALTVVGVLPEGFEFARGQPDVWVPLHLEDDGPRNAWSVSIIGRLRGDIEATRTELDDLALQLADRFPATHTGRSFPVNGLMAEIWGGPVVAQSLGASLTAAFLVLLVACTNVANLLLARGADRADEIALRRALGAGRGRILRQLLLDASLLAVAGGVLGIALSSIGLRGLANLSPEHLVRAGELRLDLRTSATAMAIALASVVVFGALPALRTLAIAEGRRLVTGARAVAGRGGRLRATLVALQVGVAVVLTTTTVLVVDSFDSVRRVDTGVRTDGVWSFRVGLPPAAYGDDPAVRDGADRLRRTVLDVPRVSEVGLAVGLPGGGFRQLAYALPGPDEATENRPRVLTRIADPGYAEIVGLEATRGRHLRPGDDADAALVGLVNERFATDLWGSDGAVGRGLVVEGRLLEIVGVVPDVREVSALSEAVPALYLPLAQWPSRGLSVVVRGPGDDPPTAELRQALATLPGDLAIRNLLRLEAVALQSGGQILALSKLLGTMALIALFLAIVGVYAATTYTVARRIPEIGLRMALGAPRARVRSNVLRGALLVTLAGLATGLPIAWGLGRAMTRFVFGSNSGAPGPYLAVAAALLLIAALAAWVPARRASAVDPMLALRSD